MTDSQTLQTYLELQKDIMFDELIDLGFATVCYSASGTSSFWNNALVVTVLSQDQIHSVANKLQELQRNPAFYFEDCTELKPFADTLLADGYKQESEDSLMFHSGEDIDTSRFDSVKKVDTTEELEVFLETFDNCYRKDDPLNPYGELGEYLISTRSAWEKHHETNRIEYFIVYDDAEPVAVATLTNHNGLGYISNVGSLMSVRGKGFGKLATLYCVWHSRNNGNTNHFLATEAGTNPNSFYSAIGFETRFTTKLMTLGAE